MPIGRDGFNLVTSFGRVVLCSGELETIDVDPASRATLTRSIGAVGMLSPVVLKQCDAITVVNAAATADQAPSYS
jgi:hypothetical protein